MELVVGLGIVLLVLVLAHWLLHAVMSLAWAVIVGLAIGSVAKLVLPGQGQVGMVRTILAGVGGSTIGSVVGHRFLHVGFLKCLILEVICAAVLIVAMGGIKRLPR